MRVLKLTLPGELFIRARERSESAKSLNRPGMAKLLAAVDKCKVQAIIVAKLDRLTRSVIDLCELLERFERHGVALISVAESLDTGSAAGRLTAEPQFNNLFYDSCAVFAVIFKGDKDIPSRKDIRGKA
jgi:hypothetical protein